MIYVTGAFLLLTPLLVIITYELYFNSQLREQVVRWEARRRKQKEWDETKNFIKRIKVAR